MSKVKEVVEKKEKNQKPPIRAIFNAIERFISNFMYMSREQIDCVNLWVIHTNLIPYLQRTPYLWINSPEPASGKSTLLEIIDYLVEIPQYASTFTAAGIARKLNKEEKTTLLLDEMDNKVGDDGDKLTSILNGGNYRKHAVYLLSKNDSSADFIELKTFGAKAIAGIGEESISTTTRSRSISIKMQKKPRDKKEQLNDLTIAKFLDDIEWIKNGLRAWRDELEIGNDLYKANPPEVLQNRAVDNWLPLFYIAGLCGEDILERCEVASIHLSGTENTPSIGTQLLTDIHTIIQENDWNKAGSLIPTAELLDSLHEIETSPWGEWNWRKTGDEKLMTSRQLAHSLKPYDIKPSKTRSHRGYWYEELKPQIERYVINHEISRNGASGNDATSVTSATSNVSDVTLTTDVTHKKDKTKINEKKFLPKKE